MTWRHPGRGLDPGGVDFGEEDFDTGGSLDQPLPTLSDGIYTVKLPDSQSIVGRPREPLPATRSRTATCSATPVRFPFRAARDR